MVERHNETAIQQLMDELRRELAKASSDDELRRGRRRARRRERPGPVERHHSTEQQR